MQRTAVEQGTLDDLEEAWPDTQVYLAMKPETALCADYSCRSAVFCRMGMQDSRRAVSRVA